MTTRRTGLLYQVGPNQTPGAIAYHMTGSVRRVAELVAANPQKSRMAGLSGLTFERLRVGEFLYLPRSWTIGVGASDPSGKTLDNGTDTIGDPVLAAAINLDNYLGDHDCDCSPQLMALTRAFQSAWNTAVSSGARSGNMLSVDGKYGSGSQLTLTAVLGHGHDACWGAGKPCSSSPTPPGGGTITPPPPPPPPPPGGNVTPVNVITTSSSILPWVLGAAAVAVGVGAMVYMKKKPGATTAGTPIHALARRTRRSSRLRRRR